MNAYGTPLCDLGTAFRPRYDQRQRPDEDWSELLPAQS